MDAQNGHRKGINILVINPNSSEAITKGLENMIAGLDYPEVCIGPALVVAMQNTQWRWQNCT
jgi:Asp/Glu/hydantoin racemase